MLTCTLLLTLTTVAPAQAAPAKFPLVKLKQEEPREHDKLKLPKGLTPGPTIPGVKSQGATPQGIAFWEKKNWFLVSCYVHEQRDPSVVVALDARTGNLERCLTLVEAGGKAHKGHLGGLAVSGKYLWIGSDQLYRVPLKAITEAEDRLQLEPPFRPICTPSYVSYDAGRVWVGEFVSVEDGIMGKRAHEMKDRNDTTKYAWAAGYALDGNEDLVGMAAGQQPLPAVVLSVRQRVQGMAFLGGRIYLSMSYGRSNDSTLAAYTNPFPAELNKPHAMGKDGGAMLPVWFLDGQNRAWENEKFPPMSEGITAFRDRLALVFESGAEQFQKGGRGPIDTVMYFTPK